MSRVRSLRKATCLRVCTPRGTPRVASRPLPACRRCRDRRQRSAGRRCCKATTRASRIPWLPRHESRGALRFQGCEVGGEERFGGGVAASGLPLLVGVVDESYVARLVVAGAS